KSQESSRFPRNEVGFPAQQGDNSPSSPSKGLESSEGSHDLLGVWYAVLGGSGCVREVRAGALHTCGCRSAHAASGRCISSDDVDTASGRSVGRAAADDVLSSGFVTDERYIHHAWRADNAR